MIKARKLLIYSIPFIAAAVVVAAYFYPANTVLQNAKGAYEIFLWVLIPLHILLMASLRAIFQKEKMGQKITAKEQEIIASHRDYVYSTKLYQKVATVVGWLVIIFVAVFPGDYSLFTTLLVCKFLHFLYMNIEEAE